MAFKGRTKRVDKDPFGLSRISNNPEMSKSQHLNHVLSPVKNVTRPFFSRPLERRLSNGGKSTFGAGGEKEKELKNALLPVLFETKGFSRVISLNKPESLHALNMEMVRMLTNLFQVCIWHYYTWIPWTSHACYAFCSFLKGQVRLKVSL